MRNILITGARGLLGRHLLPRLAGRGRLFALDRMAVDAPGVTPLLADLSRPLDPSILPPRLDAVVHLAQSSRFREFPDAAADIFQVNTALLAVLLDHARRAGASHFVHASTGGVYARSSAPLAETAPLLPPDRLGYYAATKLAGEMLAQSYAPFMTVASLRYFFIHGRGQKRDMLLPRLVDRIRQGEPVTLQGSEGMRLNPVHADDAAAATAAALALSESAAINIAGPETLSIRAIATGIGDAVGVPPRFEIQDGPAEDLVADTTLMRARLCAPERLFSGTLAELL